MEIFNKIRAQGCYSYVYSLLIILLVVVTAYAEDLQKPNVQGSFYPASRKALQDMVDDFIDKPQPEPIEGDVVAIIVPHAGYEYSGWVAGYAFKAVKDKPFNTAIIIAPSHRYSFDGLSVLAKDSYLTPLGKVAIDKKITDKLLQFDKRINYHAKAFSAEHAAEVEIPFVQTALKGCKIVVIITGTHSYDTAILLREALSSLLKERDDVLLIASSDMSHHHLDSNARLIDGGTLSIIEKLDPDMLFLRLSSGESELCGRTGVVGVMMAARELGADKVKILRYATSADVTGDNRAVVGYSAIALYRSSAKKENDMIELLTASQKKRLLQIARRTLKSYIEKREVPEIEENDPTLNQEMGAFISLYKNGQLRGCIGNMVGKGPLYKTVQDMAIAAATEDPRFSPVAENKLKNIDIEISVLSQMEKIDDPEKIVMGRHGVMVQSGFRSGVYLPQVATEAGWNREEFMDSLCLHKAGIAADSWKSGECDIYIFTAEAFSDREKSK